MKALNTKIDSNVQSKKPHEPIRRRIVSQNKSILSCFEDDVPDLVEANKQMKNGGSQQTGGGLDQMYSSLFTENGRSKKYQKVVNGLPANKSSMPYSLRTINKRQTPTLPDSFGLKKGSLWFFCGFYWCFF